MVRSFIAFIFNFEEELLLTEPTYRARYLLRRMLSVIGGLFVREWVCNNNAYLFRSKVLQAVSFAVREHT